MEKMMKLKGKYLILQMCALLWTIICYNTSNITIYNFQYNHFVEKWPRRRWLQRTRAGEEEVVEKRSEEGDKEEEWAAMGDNNRGGLECSNKGRK